VPRSSRRRLSVIAANLQPGIYKIEIKVNDNISKQTIDPSAVFMPPTHPLSLSDLGSEPV